MTKGFALALVLVLAIVAAACGEYPTGPQSDSTGLSASALSKAEADLTAGLEKAQATLAEIKAERQPSEGWAEQIRPGDTRSAYNILMSLRKMEGLQDEVHALGLNDRTEPIRVEIRTLMLNDLKLLLRASETENYLAGVGEFLRIAPGLDTSLEEDFGVKPEEVRTLALKIAKSELAEERIGTTEGSDMAGYALGVLREWQFTPEELGLSAEDMKVIRGR